jgi:hypothetical protein
MKYVAGGGSASFSICVGQSESCAAQGCIGIEAEGRGPDVHGSVETEIPKASMEAAVGVRGASRDQERASVYRE